jgi:signal transduction histidine kinase
MPTLRDLSLRHKVPLRVTVLVIATALVVTATLVFRESDELRRGLVANASALGRVLAKTLVEPLVHDDVWRAYEIISSPFLAAPPASDAPGVELILILDGTGRVFVSTDPTRFPPAVDPSQTDPALAAVADLLDTGERLRPQVIQPAEVGRLFVTTPIVADGELLATLVIGYHESVVVPRIVDLVQRAALVTLLALGVVLPIAWWWGRRVASPLVRLAQAMGKTGPRLPADRELDLYESRDEIGQLGTAFRRMVAGLREKEALEAQVMVSDRLAAVGRLAAGIAHEINNPLGGMLNAINTYGRHGAGDALTLKTLSLLERGLLQIRDTVGALLVEARVQVRALDHRDLEDVHLLIQPDANARRIDLAWDNAVPGTLPLPSTLVRQVLINLLLNAVDAAARGGRVACHARVSGRELQLVVRNDGAHIAPQDLPYLFEPFVSRGGKGRGLGLWVTYQIVHQLKGDLSVQSEPGETVFTVHLPLQEPYAYPSAA